ncbi:MAG TPA: hypothetical protein VJU86_07665 [Pyrinomonadaceae bacterium]|nr:hypothetical protein [Pyrinomonadaceae bacterium]
MSTPPTEKEFSQHLHTNFHLDIEGEEPLNLELIDVKGYLKKEDEHPGMERFSAMFQGPVQPALVQKLYHLKHDSMGDLDIFIVPIAKNAQGVVYEAVYNYFQAPTSPE